jgi:hypothetical protein
MGKEAFEAIERLSIALAHRKDKQLGFCDDGQESPPASSNHRFNHGLKPGAIRLDLLEIID